MMPHRIDVDTGANISNNNGKDSNSSTPSLTPIDVSVKTVVPITSVTSNNSNNKGNATYVEQLKRNIALLPRFAKIFIIATTVIHFFQLFPSFHSLVKSYFVYQPAKIFTHYLIYTPVTSLFLNSSFTMLLINNIGIIFSLSFITQNHFLSERKLLNFLLWNSLFGALSAMISWTILWYLIGSEYLLEAGFPGATAALNSLSLLLAHFSPETSLPVHRKLRMKHLPGLYFLLVPVCFLFISWEDSILCLAGLIGGWVVIRYIWKDRREQWSFMHVFLPDRLQSLFSKPISTNTTNDVDLELGPLMKPVEPATEDVSAMKSITKNNRRLIGEQALIEKLKKKENEKRQRSLSNSANAELKPAEHQPVH